MKKSQSGKRLKTSSKRLANPSRTKMSAAGKSRTLTKNSPTWQGRLCRLLVKRIAPANINASIAAQPNGAQIDGRAFGFASSRIGKAGIQESIIETG